MTQGKPKGWLKGQIKFKFPREEKKRGRKMLMTEIMHHRGGLPAPPDPSGPRASGPGDATGQ